MTEAVQIAIVGGVVTTLGLIITPILVLRNTQATERARVAAEADSEERKKAEAEAAKQMGAIHELTNSRASVQDQKIEKLEAAIAEANKNAATANANNEQLTKTVAQLVEALGQKAPEAKPQEVIVTNTPDVEVVNAPEVEIVSEPLKPVHVTSVDKP